MQNCICYIYCIYTVCIYNCIWIDIYNVWPPALQRLNLGKAIAEIKKVMATYKREKTQAIWTSEKSASSRSPNHKYLKLKINRRGSACVFVTMGVEMYDIRSCKFVWYDHLEEETSHVQYIRQNRQWCYSS